MLETDVKVPIVLTLLNEQQVLPCAPHPSQSTHRPLSPRAAVGAGDVHPSASRLKINPACGMPPLADPALAYLKKKKIIINMGNLFSIIFNT